MCTVDIKDGLQYTIQDVNAMIPKIQCIPKQLNTISWKLLTKDMFTHAEHNIDFHSCLKKKSTHYTFITDNALKSSSHQNTNVWFVLSIEHV